jgi:2-amino-4-hydroxy-6-hydroxymethyldihydropteridine diphosphokinase
VIAYVGIGSNRASHAGPPAETVKAALAALSELGEVVAQSSLYETEPLEYTEQPVFINAVAAVRTELLPEAVLGKLLEVERCFGRDRKTGIPKGPRVLDLDLLMADDQVLHTPTLTVPHPAMAKRRFVLAPLAEIAPGLRHPLLHKTMRELLRELPEEGVRRLS